jgi:hypothetical protein
MLVALACAAPPAISPLATLRRTPEEPDRRGVVTEVVAAGGYAYLRVEERWYATVAKGIATGEQVRLDPIGVARDFHSRRTGRTFSELWFASVQPDQP